ncbi:putative monothiol glutaredoxin F10D7.3 [Aphelenchoides fujianensis]|nr:putative monothiol glutaredoxin F10D7.3 [Aphelenchoides fujianensis]
MINDHKVTLFSKTYCPYSKKIKRLLEPYKIEDMKVVEVDLRSDRKLVQDELAKYSHIHTVPQLFVDHKFVGNSDTVSELERNNKLRPILQAAHAISN